MGERWNRFGGEDGIWLGNGGDEAFVGGGQWVM